MRALTAKPNVKIISSGKNDTRNNQFDCRKEGKIVYIAFVNGAGANNVRLIFGGVSLTIAAGSAQAFNWQHPYYDTTLYEYEFVPPAGGGGTNSLQIIFAKIVDDGEE